MPREFSAGAVIFRKEEGNTYYLLLRYEGKHWDFPKGHIEKGESYQQTVAREVEEETGIKDIRIIPGFSHAIRYFFRQYREKVSEKDRRKGKTPWVFKMVKFFLAETQTKEVVLSPEHTEYKWLDYASALKRLTHKNAKDVLKKANGYIIKMPA